MCYIHGAVKLTSRCCLDTMEHSKFKGIINNSQQDGYLIGV